MGQLKENKIEKYDNINKLYQYEVENNISQDDRLTEWHSDYGFAIPKYIYRIGYVEYETILKRLKELNL